MRKWIHIGILGLAVLVSCSVKEDRSDCPCWLTIRADNTANISAWFGNQVLLQNQKGGIADFKVPRGIVDVVANLGQLVVSEGNHMSELYASVTSVDTQAEDAVVAPVLHKQFARVYLEFEDTEDGRVEQILEVHGYVKGADRHSLAPVEGFFRCTPDESAERGYELRVPRQKDDSLLLIHYTLEGEELEPIPIGKLIKKAGFDWTKESLGDVSIVADIPASTFQITIMDWEGPITMTVTI